MLVTYLVDFMFITLKRFFHKMFLVSVGLIETSKFRKCFSCMEVRCVAATFLTTQCYTRKTISILKIREVKN